MRKETVEVFIEEKKLNRRIAELAHQINNDYKGKTLHIICILKGSIFFTCELTKRLDIPVKIDFMQVSSYGDGTESSGQVKIIKDLEAYNDN